jgi:5-methyltetrahydrofolate--homocysteine methyltransferase
MTTIREQLNTIASERILMLDGAMGSLIQSFHLTEDDFRGRQFADHKARLAGCNDVLCLTKGEVITAIHEDYLKAGADMIETCSFNSTAISLADYGIGDSAYEISAAAARLARQAADAYSSAGKPRFVAGSMGPTAKCGSLSPNINEPEKRAVTWDELEPAYYDNARGLLDGGADILLIETMVDTLNAKAALFAVSRLMEERDIDIPVMISASVGESGRLLTGQSLEAFSVSVLHGKPWALGLNCSFGADRLRAPIRTLAACAPCLVSAYPNAGMPNLRGEYEESPSVMAALTESYLREGLVNILGGCCGTTPAHIAAMAASTRMYPPRVGLSRPAQNGMNLAGLDVHLIKLEERAKPAESKDFLRFIQEADYDGAADIIRDTVEANPRLIEVCIDGAVDAAETAVAVSKMTRFLCLALSYPDIARCPLMVSSSCGELIEGALKLIQGKALVNYTGPHDEALERKVQRYGAYWLDSLADSSIRR